MIPDDYDYEALGERLAQLVVYALEPAATGQNLWRVRGSLRDPRMREYTEEVLADTRRTAAELREMVTLLERAAAMYEAWLKVPP